MLKKLTIAIALYASFPLLGSDAIASSCGLFGSVEQRLQECARDLGAESEVVTPQGGKWRIVAAASSGPILVQDEKGAIWTGTYNMPLIRPHAVDLCRLPNFAADFKAHLDVSFRLPSTNTLSNAVSKGLFVVVPSALSSYWTSETSGDLFGFVYNALTGEVMDLPVERPSGVLCVSQIGS